MKYPKLPEELDNRRKLTSTEIEEIRKLYKAGGWTHRSLGVEYGVSKTMIRYYVIEPEEREKINKKRYERMAQQKIDDPEFAKKHRQQTIKSYVEGYKKLEARRVYKGKGTYKWKKNKLLTNEEFRIKTNRQSLESYHRNKQLGGGV